MTGPDLDLAEGESLVAASDELLYRQITKSLIDENGQIATHAFTGHSSSDGRPSYSRESVVTAQESRDWHTRNSRSPSLGVRALSAAEVVGVGRWVIDDGSAPLTEGVERPRGHCYIDVRNLDRATLKSLRVELWEAAMARGEVPTRDSVADGEIDMDTLSR